MSDSNVTVAPSPSRSVPSCQAAPGSDTESDPLDNHDGAAQLRLDFAPRIDQAWTRFRSAAEQLNRADLALRDEGRPPSYELILALGECHREFLRMRLDLARRARALAIPASSLDALTGLGELARWLDSLTGVPDDPAPASAPFVDVLDTAPIAEPEVADPEVTEPEVTEPEVTEPEVAEPEVTEPKVTEPEVAMPDAQPPETFAPEPEIPVEHPGESVRGAALAVLDAVLRLSLRDRSELPALDQCQTRARALRDQIADAPANDLPADANELATGGHPFVGLLSLIGGVSALSDARWATVHAQVVEAFGRPLAVAAARGRLVVPPSD